MRPRAPQPSPGSRPAAVRPRAPARSPADRVAPGRTDFLIVRPAAASIHRLTGSATDTMVRCVPPQSRPWRQTGRACRSCSDILNDFSIWDNRRQTPITNSAVTGVPAGQAARSLIYPYRAARSLALSRTRLTVFMPPQRRINRLRLTAAFPATESGWPGGPAMRAPG